MIMGKQTFILILFLAVCGHSFRGLFRPTNFSPLIERVFTLDGRQLNQLSKELAQRFSLTTYNQLNQSHVRSLVTRFTIAANDVATSPTPPSLKDISRFFYNVHKSLENTGICAICQLVIALFQLDATFLPVLVQLLCEVYMTLSTFSMSNFCSGLEYINLPSLKFIRENSTILDPQLACTVILQTKDCYFSKSALTWNSTISTSPKIIPQVTTCSTNTPLKILHISDFHLSLNYKEGSVIDCGYPLCCLEGLGNPLRGGKAGFWGDYRCDLAPSLFLHALRHISDTHPDLTSIFYTGDVVDHSIWNTSVQSNTETITYAFKTLQQTFPNTPVFPIIGNHDYHPTNVAPPSRDDRIKSAGLDQQWLYDSVAELWASWLSASAIQNVQKYGYYAHNYSSTLKIIGINSNLCYCYNWWLLYDTTFLQEHLNWLNDELQESELNGQRVYIIGHNSMGNGECIEPFEANYNKLIERFSHIIMAQLVGHTHTDEMKIFYDSNNNPVNVAWNGASLTTFQDFNPNYKIMYVCPETWEILDVDTYVFNMTTANLTPNQGPNWYKLYSMKSHYDLTDLSPKSYDELCDRMNANESLRNLYWLNSVRYGDASIEKGCDDNCQQDILCKMPQTQTYKQIKPYCK